MNRIPFAATIILLAASPVSAKHSDPPAQEIVVVDLTDSLVGHQADAVKKDIIARAERLEAGDEIVVYTLGESEGLVERFRASANDRNPNPLFAGKTAARREFEGTVLNPLDALLDTLNAIAGASQSPIWSTISRLHSIESGTGFRGQRLLLVTDGLLFVPGLVNMHQGESPCGSSGLLRDGWRADLGGLLSVELAILRRAGQAQSLDFVLAAWDCYFAACAVTDYELTILSDR